MKIAIFDEKVIKPFASFGFTGDFWGIHIETVIFTWLAMLMLFILVLVGYFFLKKDLNIPALIFETTVSTLNNLCEESLGGHFQLKYLNFIATIFFFTVSCCLVGLFPYVEEPTKDVNTTLALGCLSFFYVQYQSIRLHGLWAYFKEYCEPFIFMLPLNIIGEVAKIASMSFRLFGNILGGSIIFLILTKAISVYGNYYVAFCLIGFLTYLIIVKVIDLQKHKAFNILSKIILGSVFFLAAIQLLFGVIEGFVQSFVLTMLTITYLAVATQKEEVDH